MLCQICHAEEATVYLIETINNKHTTMHICESCAQKRHLGEILSKPALAMHELLTAILQLGSAPITEKQILKCPRCGMTFNRFKEVGRFGCAECYQVFQQSLLPLFRQFHQADQHRGRRDKKSVTSKRLEITKLKQHLQDAIANEDFEEAVKLRDSIRKLERTPHEPHQ
jgi:protein arginine kinase activator